MGLTGQLFILVVLGAAGTALLRGRRQVLRTLRMFFIEEGGPFNLAVFRIVFFGAFALFFLPPLDQVKHFAALPKSVQTPPWLLGGLLSSLPLDATWVTAAYVLMIVGCTLAAIGLLTRLAAAVVVVSGFYYLGVEQLYGKIDHGHHLLWIAAIFAASRAGDALSVDSLIRAWHSPRPDTDVRSRAYTLPLRFIWLLVACCYFFPGIQKLRFDSWRWLRPETLEGWLHLLWFQNANYRPPIVSRPDHLPLFLAMGALATMAFELGWFTLIFTRATRFVAACAQIAFHNMTNALMLIPFWGLQVSAISLIDWEWLSQVAFRQRGALTVAYDGKCSLCGRTVAALRAFAFPSSLAYVNVLDDAALPATRIRVDQATLLTDMHVFASDGRSYVGYDAYRRLAWRIPVLWPVIPVLALPPVATAGRRIYRRIAHSRACGVARASVPSLKPLRLRPLALTGIALLFAVGFVGLYGTLNAASNAKAGAGWPIASYPSFIGFPNDTTRQIRLVGVRSDGRVEPVSLASELAFMPWQRRAGFVRSLVDVRASAAQEKLNALIDYVRSYSAGRWPFSTIRVYRDVVSTRPDDPGRVLRSAMILRLRQSSNPLPGRYAQASEAVKQLPTRDAPALR